MASLALGVTASTQALRFSPLRAVRAGRSSISAPKVCRPAACRSALQQHQQQEAKAVSRETEASSQQVVANDDAAFDRSGFLERAVLMAAASATPMLLAPEMSWATGGEFGILEGRTAALVHPLVMAGLFFLTLYAGYLGWQWRRVRELGDEIAQLKKASAPEDKEGEPVSAAALQIEQLTQERTALVKGGFRDKHAVAGSWLLFAGVGIAVEGCVNTYMRTGRLFPGPHLWAGTIIVVLWAAAAALVPAMQKGNGTARNLHVALNGANVLLFVSQIPTGWEIVLKVFQFTSWP